MKKVIITGASGFIGIRLVNKLCEENIEVIAVVRPNSKNRDKLIGKKIRIIECDMKNISELPSLMDDRDVDTLYHLAWEGSSGLARNDYKVQMENVLQSVECLKVANLLKIKRFISIGTIAERLMENIDSMPNIAMSAMYSITKDYTHKLLNAISKQIDIEFIWCRLTNIYGPGDNTENLINYTIENVINHSETFYSSGNQPCNLLYIDDCIEALICIGKANNINHHTYFVGGIEIRSVRYFVEKTKDLIDRDVKLGWGERKDDGIVYSPEWLGTWEIQNDFGFMAQTSFDKGIRKTIKWKIERQNIDR